MIKLLGVLIAGAFIAPSAGASCQCVCMDGAVQAVCSSSLDIEPICAPRICPIVPPSIKPIQRPRIPPIGARKCVQKRIYNERTRRYDWQEVCY